MDRRTITAVVLSLAIWYGWLAIRGQTTPPEGEETEGALPPPQPGAPVPAGIEAPPAATQELGPDKEVVPFTACGAQGSIGTNGGRLHSLTLPDYEGTYQVTPLYQWIWGRATGALEGPWLAYGPDPGPEILLSPDARALSVGVGNTPVPMQVAQREPSRVELQGTSFEGVQVTQRYREHREGEACWIEVEVSFHNLTPLTVPPFLGLHDHPSDWAGGGMLAATSSYAAHRQPMVLSDNDVYYGGPLGAGCVRQGTKLSDDLTTIPLPQPVSWFAMADRYFGLYTVVPEGSPGSATLTRIGAGETALDGTVYRWPALPAGGTQTETYRIYVGPNQTPALEAVAPDLGRAVDLGWSAFFGYPLLWLLRVLQGFSNNWGLAIILLTVVVKALFFPMTQRSMKSMQRMQQIQPELQAIKEKYADNPTEMNRLTIELMTKHQVNPVAGCLPTLVQIPVWIALYQVILTSPDLYHTEFLYLRDLSSPDPYLVLPILVMGLMWLQQQLSTPPNMDPVQQQVMKFMPIMIGLFFFAAPSGLAIYMFVNITLSILQQWLIKRSLGKGGLPAAAAS
jgi:YidC/Oxa1 family membrane protein insertase